MRIALYQPDITGNVGTILRTATCFGVQVDIIEPCGFPFSDRKLKRAGMGYAAAAQVSRYVDWNAFCESRTGRLVLLTVTGGTSFPDAQFAADDILLTGSESTDVPDHVNAAAGSCVRIPIRKGFRSLNVARATGIASGEALRQTEEWPV